MALVLTAAKREIRRKLTVTVLKGLARHPGQPVGLALRVAGALPFVPITSEVGKAFTKKLAAGDHAFLGFIARLGTQLSECSTDRFVTNLLVTPWVEGRAVRDRFEREEGFSPPNFIVVSPTMRCNFRCRGCWAAEYEDVPEMEGDLLDKIVRECVEDLGIRFFTIAGGEPFVRRDLLDFYERHRDCYFQVYTNGVLIDDEVAERLGRMGNVAPMLSVEGGRDSTDERRGAGTHDALARVARRLTEAGVLHGFAVTATRRNVREVSSDAFVDEMIARGSLVGWYFHYVPVGESPDPDLMLSAEERDRLRTRVYELRNTKPIFLADFWNDGPCVQGCMAGGKRYLHINPRGDVEPCVFAHFAVDNVREKSLREALRHPFMAAIRDGIPYDGNLLRPCMITDRPRVLRRVVAAFGAHATHPGAESILTTLAPMLDEKAARLAEVMDEVWNEGEWQHLYVTAKDLGVRRKVSARPH